MIIEDRLVVKLIRLTIVIIIIASSSLNIDATTKANRIYGTDRYQTGLKVASEILKLQGDTKFDNVVVADGRNYPDALSGAYLAKLLNAPIILVCPDNEKEIAEEIKSKNRGKTYILGGYGAVSESFEKRINNTVRLGGQDRYETNLLILHEIKRLGGENRLFVCTGENYADSLSASAFPNSILLVNDELTPKQIEYLQSYWFDQINIIGGTGAVSKQLDSEIMEITDQSCGRILGGDRYETSDNLAYSYGRCTGERDYIPSAAIVVVGDNFPDGLTGGLLAMQIKAPILLVNDSCAQEMASNRVNHYSSGYVIGGNVLIKDSSVDTIIGNKGSTGHQWLITQYGTKYPSIHTCRRCGMKYKISNYQEHLDSGCHSASYSSGTGMTESTTWKYCPDCNKEIDMYIERYDNRYTHLNGGAERPTKWFKQFEGQYDEEDVTNMEMTVWIPWYLVGYQAEEIKEYFDKTYGSGYLDNLIAEYELDAMEPRVFRKYVTFMRLHNMMTDEEFNIEKEKMETIWKKWETIGYEWVQVGWYFNIMYKPDSMDAVQWRIDNGTKNFYDIFMN